MQIAAHQMHRKRMQRMSPPPPAVPPVIALPPVEPVAIPAHAVHVPWFCDKITVERIKTAVAEHFNVTRIDMVSARRTETVVLPRQVAMYLAKTVTLRSLPEIGRRFGGRDHTTVLHAVRKIEAAVLTDPEIAARVEAIKESMGIET